MSNSRPLILVVEDEYNLLYGIRDILEIGGYDAACALNGVQALEFLHTAPRLPNVILSDISMPDMDGYDLLDSVRQKHEWTEIPFIFLTAKIQHEDQRTGMIAGANDYLPKPFKPVDLLGAIQAQIKHRDRVENAHTQQIKRVKHDILIILSHEFRTPLTPVVAYADLINTDPATLSGEELETFLSGIRNGAERLRRLVDDLLLLVELETGEAQIAYSYYSHPIVRRELHNLLTGVITQYSDRAAARQLTLVLAEPLPTDLPRFAAAPDYLTAALARLVENAIKFSDKPGGQVWIGVRAESDRVLIEVADQGRGIPDTESEAIFESFYQIDRAQNEDQGSGSGLAIVKAIMALHGGQVSVASQVGVGSVFTLAFPVL
ncbi:MAG: ATP-binding response regulator [Aggregatilineales bacterium]